MQCMILLEQFIYSCMFSYLGKGKKISILCRFKHSVLKIATRSLLITSFPRVFYKWFCMCLSWSWHGQVCCGRGAPRLRSAGLQSAFAGCIVNGNERALPGFLGSLIFSPQSFSSGHTKGLPIGIISSFVLLTSMKLIFPCILILLHFVLYVVAIWGGLPSSDFCTLKEAAAAFSAARYIWINVYS